jgi:Xaa-Pro aminopeptidase
MKMEYTAVLKGNLALSHMRFPKGTLGSALDSIAKRPLWEIHRTYFHGTGHGVGHLTSVHEGPESIRSPREGISDVPLEAGMILSDEPGCYITDSHGIRLENLLLVKEDTNHPGYLCFEILTLAPFEKEAILWDQLSEEEMQWLVDYHHDVVEKLSPYLEKDVLKWLKHFVNPLHV